VSPSEINLPVKSEGDIFAKGGSFSFRRTWVNYIPAVTIKEVKSFYPRDNAEGIFILGRDLNNTYGLFYYDLVTKQVSNLFEKYPLPKNHRSLVDFVYSMN